MSKRILLHVGTPKTGTSHLQDVLLRNQEVLADHGILYPADRFDAHFLAALDLMDLPWGGLETEAVGRWDALAAAVREWPGTAIISHEVLATATRPQIERALRSLGVGSAAEGSPEVELHLVITTRDLVRQIPAEWQENVKHRSTITYQEFLEVIADPERPGRIGDWFWGVQEIPDILERWGATLPADRVHVVTVPARGAPPEVLWSRLSRTFGLDGLPLDQTPEKANPSLGVPETALLRRINERIVSELPPADYRPLVRELLAHRTLSARTGSARLALPPHAHAHARALSDSWISEIRTRGYRVVGDLDDLRGDDPMPFADPDHADEAAIGDASMDVISALLHECARLTARDVEAQRQVHEAHDEVLRAYLTPAHRLKRRIFDELNERGAGRAVLQAYRRVRGRNSFPA